MSSKLFSLVTYFIVFCLLTVVDAALYVVTPLSGSTCRGGQPCTVTWLDNGQSPLLSAIGVSHVALYTGTLKLVQTLPPVDVGSTLSFTFTPDPAAGPNSDAYYLAFTSTEAKVNGSEYRAYSPWFRLEGMTGSFDRPLPSATSSIPVPSSLTTKASSTVLSTITVGTLSTEIPSPSISLPPSPSSSSSSSSSSTSRLVTSTINSSTATAAAASSTAPPPLDSGAMGSSTHLSRLSLCLIALVLGAALAS